MSGTHKTLSPSARTRRRICLGSLAACKGEKNPNSIYAAEGSAYHLLASTVLEELAKGKQGVECDDWVGQIIHVPHEGDAAFGENVKAQFSFKINSQDAAHAQSYVDAMLRRKQVSGNVRQLYEVKLDTSDVVGVPGQGGTGDCVTLDFENRVIYVDDLKFGKGKQVYASWEDDDKVKQPNDQCAQYGAAALRMLHCLGPWKKVVMGIHMPRMFPFTDEFEMTVEELDAWVTKWRPHEQEAYRLWESGTDEEIMAALKPSKEGCTFCPLDGQCKAQIDAALNAFPLIQQPDGPNEARRQMWKATDAEFLRVLNIAEEYSSFFGEVFTEAFRRETAKAGSLPGWTIKLGNKGRRTLDPAAELPPVLDEDGETELQPAAKVKELIDEVVGADAYEPAELKTAAELDKTLNKVRGIPKDVVAKRKSLWERLQAAITQPDGQPKLVRENAPGAPYERKPTLEFGIIPNQ